MVHEGELTDGELIERVGNGDSDAFDELSAATRVPCSVSPCDGSATAAEPRMRSRTRSPRSGAPPPATTRHEGQGGAWLYTVARNAIVDGARRRPEPPMEAPEEASGESGPPEQAEAAWLAWRVHSAIEQLPEHERPVIELAYWGGLSQSEISDFLHVPLGTVKTRTRSALARLADMLEEELT